MNFLNFKQFLFESEMPILTRDQGNNIWWHGSTDKNLDGKKGIHVGTKLAATQALEARIGIPASGEWDGKREYGKTLLAGEKRLIQISKQIGYSIATGYNVNVPEEDYYPIERKQRAVYSDRTLVSFNCKPVVFSVSIIGKMTNSPYSPHSDERANSMMLRNLKQGNAKSGYYYLNIGEDYGSVSAVVPDKSFLKIL